MFPFIITLCLTVLGITVGYSLLLARRGMLILRPLPLIVLLTPILILLMAFLGVVIKRPSDYFVYEDLTLVLFYLTIPYFSVYLYQLVTRLSEKTTIIYRFLCQAGTGIFGMTLFGLTITNNLSVRHFLLGIVVLCFSSIIGQLKRQQTRRLHTLLFITLSLLSMLLLFFNISQHLFMKIALYIGVWVVPFLYTHIRLKKHGAIELYSIPLQWLFLLGLEYVFPKFLGLYSNAFLALCLLVLSNKKSIVNLEQRVWWIFSLCLPLLFLIARGFGVENIRVVQWLLLVTCCGIVSFQIWSSVWWRNLSKRNSFYLNSFCIITSLLLDLWIRSAYQEISVYNSTKLQLVETFKKSGKMIVVCEGIIPSENKKTLSVFNRKYENNISLSLSNTGVNSIRDIKLTYNQSDWFDINNIINRAISNSRTEHEIALKFWDFLTTRMPHASTYYPDKAYDIDNFIVFAYAHCGQMANRLAALCQKTGLKNYRSSLKSHITIDIVCNDKPYHLDANRGIFTYGYENRYISSTESIKNDPYLLARWIHMPNLKLHKSYSKSSLLRRVRWIMSPFILPSINKTNSFIYTLEDLPKPLSLRPGESLHYNWDFGSKFFTADKKLLLHNLNEKRMAITNGQLQFNPPKAFLNVFKQKNIQLQTTTESVTISLLDPEREGSMTWEFKSPYIMVGGQMHLDFENKGVGLDRIEVSTDNQTWTSLSKMVTRYSQWVNKPTSLDSFFETSFHPIDTYYVKLIFDGQIKKQKQTSYGRLKMFQVNTDLQMSYIHLPVLKNGMNEIMFSCSNNEPVQLELNHTWKQFKNTLLPDKPTLKVDTSNTILCETTNKDYQIEINLCERPDFFIVAPQHQYITQGSLSLDPKLFRPKIDYYIRARTVTGEDIYSDWIQGGPVQFNHPAPVQSISARVDTENMSITLSWNPSKSVNKPTYHIYGSNIRGFAPHKTPYDFFLNNIGDLNWDIESNKRKLMLPNWVTSTNRTEVTITYDSNKPLLAFYRIIVEDFSGQESVSSQQVETLGLLTNSSKKRLQEK